MYLFHRIPFSSLVFLLFSFPPHTSFLPAIDFDFSMISSLPLLLLCLLFWAVPESIRFYQMKVYCCTRHSSPPSLPLFPCPPLISFSYSLFSIRVGRRTRWRCCEGWHATTEDQCPVVASSCLPRPLTLLASKISSPLLSALPLFYSGSFGSRMPLSSILVLHFFLYIFSFDNGISMESC